MCAPSPAADGRFVARASPGRGARRSVARVRGRTRPTPPRSAPRAPVGRVVPEARSRRRPAPTTTRSKRSGSRGSGVAVRQASRIEQAYRTGARRACACGHRRSPRAGRSPAPARQRTSTTTSAAGGPGSRATRSSSSRPTRTFLPSTVQPPQAVGDELLRRIARPLGAVRVAGTRPRRSSRRRVIHARATSRISPGPATAYRPLNRRHEARPARHSARRTMTGTDLREARELARRRGRLAERSRAIWSPASVRCSARNERRWNGVRPELADRGAVLARGVALVVLPAVARVARRELGHHPVADDLGHDRRARDRVDLGVAVDDVVYGPTCASKPAIRLPSTSTCSWPPRRAIARRIARCVAW